MSPFTEVSRAGKDNDVARRDAAWTGLEADGSR
jgi:hypothetical protein